MASLALSACWRRLRPRAQLPFRSRSGARALGMAGAFVAVADDPRPSSGTRLGWSNGAAGGMTIGWDRFQFGNQD